MPFCSLFNNSSSHAITHHCNVNATDALQIAITKKISDSLNLSICHARAIKQGWLKDKGADKFNVKKKSLGTMTAAKKKKKRD